MFSNGHWVDAIGQAVAVPSAGAHSVGWEAAGQLVVTVAQMVTCPTHWVPLIEQAVASSEHSVAGFGQIVGSGSSGHSVSVIGQTVNIGCGQKVGETGHTVVIGCFGHSVGTSWHIVFSMTCAQRVGSTGQRVETIGHLVGSSGQNVGCEHSVGCDTEHWVAAAGGSHSVTGFGHSVTIVWQSVGSAGQKVTIVTHSVITNGQSVCLAGQSVGRIGQSVGRTGQVVGRGGQAVAWIGQ